MMQCSMQDLFFYRYPNKGFEGEVHAEVDTGPTFDEELDKDIDTTLIFDEESEENLQQEVDLEVNVMPIFYLDCDEKLISICNPRSPRLLPLM